METIIEKIKNEEYDKFDVYELVKLYFYETFSGSLIIDIPPKRLQNVCNYHSQLLNQNQLTNEIIEKYLTMTCEIILQLSHIDGKMAIIDVKNFEKGLKKSSIKFYSQKSESKTYHNIFTHVCVGIVCFVVGSFCFR